jgi:diaminopimelate decarboxylase
MINGLGRLEIGGCDAVELAAKYGTPLHVVDETTIRQQCRGYIREFSSRYPQFGVVFAGKALLTTALCRIVEQEGLSLDVSSAGELLTALKAKFPPERIVVHGNYKSAEEIRMAVETGAGRHIIDWTGEIQFLEQECLRQDKKCDALLRITPGVHAETHHYIETGQLDSKFGIPMPSFLGAIREAQNSPSLNLKGVHCHIGSQIFNLDCFARTVAIIASALAEAREKTGFIAEELDLGGGLGIRYLKDDDPPSIADLAEVICTAVKSEFKRRNLPLPRLFVEPGRSIVGEAGVTLYTIGVVKDIPGVRKYVAVDGGMSDNPRPALYGAKYEVLLANKADQPATESVTIAGKHCETDTLVEEAVLPPVEVGDHLAVLSTGAYHYSMASNYNRFPKPAVVLVCEGQDDVIVRRQTLEEVIAQDCLPVRLDGSPRCR